MNHGAWAAYGPISLGEYATLNIRAASANKGGTVTLRADSLSGPVVGVLTVERTGDWDRWSTFTATLAPTTGTRMLYLTFANEETGGGMMMLVDWFELLPD